MKNNFSKIRNADKGFTLIELLVVMVILGIMGTFVTVGVMNHLKKAKVHAAKTQIELFKGLLQSFKLDVGRYPTSAEGLIALRIQPGNAKNWNGPYAEEQLPLDPWGNKYYYKCPGEHTTFDIFSYGADGLPGGEDENKDIVSWETAGQSDDAYLN